ncbi:MAG: hypothetical protein ACJA02_000019 [Myxococcota bacterium]|jgi:hypothetical protein
MINKPLLREVVIFLGKRFSLEWLFSKDYCIEYSEESKSSASANQ